MTDATPTALPTYKIYAIRYAQQPLRDEGHTYLGGEHGRMIPGLDFFMWAIEGNGRTIVVDTGFSRETNEKRPGREWLFRPKDGLARIGIDTSKVEEVILTHAHFDHVGTLEDFPKATFWMPDREMFSITGRDMTHPFFRVAYDPDDVCNLVRLAHGGRMRFYDEDGEYAPGIRWHLIGGHARGQMALSVWTERGWVILASDAIHLYEEAAEERPFAIFHDLQVMIEGYRKLNALAASPDHVIPGHDQLVTKRFPAAAPDLENVVVRLDLAPKAA